jgi:hypothetical protein
LQVFSVSSIRLILFAVFSTSLTLAKASGLISLADGWGGNGCPAGIILRTAGGVIRTDVALSNGFGDAGFTEDLALVAVLLVAACFDDVDVTRLDSPKRWTLPITALRVTPPNALAMMLAD